MMRQILALFALFASASAFVPAAPAAGKLLVVYRGILLLERIRDNGPTDARRPKTTHAIRNVGLGNVQCIQS